MTHDERSLNTKRAFSAALKKLMETKPLNKITVKDLITECNVNRKTFYYHFTDIYDLLTWTLEEETVNVLQQFDLVTDFRDAALFVMNYVEENNHILKCVYDSIGREELKRFLLQDFIQIVQNTVDRFETELGLTLSEQYKMFVTVFYTEAIAGEIIDWLQRSGQSNHLDKETAVAYLDTILFSSVPAVLQAGTDVT